MYLAPQVPIVGKIMNGYPISSAKINVYQVKQIHE